LDHPTNGLKPEHQKTMKEKVAKTKEAFDSKAVHEIDASAYMLWKNGWIPHNAGFGFMDLTPATLGQIHF
jgi:hypothetical protein